MIILILVGFIALVVLIAYVLQWSLRRQRAKFDEGSYRPGPDDALSQKELGEQLYREDMSQIQVDASSKGWR